MGDAEASGGARYRWYVVGAGLLVVCQALFIAGLLVERTGRRRAEVLLAERLRFESLLAELSARLIPASLGDVDSEIEGGLRQVGEFMGVDRASLDEYVPGEAAVRISWGVAGMAKPFPSIEAGSFPWTEARLRQGQLVRFVRPDELLEESATDRQSYREAGTRSCLLLPLISAGRVVGVLSFDTLQRECTWPEELVQRLRLLGEVFAGALERKRLELALAERLRFETLLSEQSATFTSLSATEVDLAIKRALRRIADFLRADWGSLVEFSNDSRIARITHSWVAEGAAPAPSAVALAEIPWVTGRLHGGEVVRFSRIDELPAEEAAVDRRTYLSLGVKSQVEVPLRAAGMLLGALTFSTLGSERLWPDDLVQRLQLLGEVFANVLARRQGEMEAQRLRDELNHVARVATMGALTTSLAHELNQPLTAILSNAQVAQDVLGATPLDVEEMRAILADIVEDDKRAGEVIRRLRGLLRKERREVTALDVNEIVREVARFISGDAVLRNVAVRLELAEQLPRVQGDRVHLQQVILNLILNGLDAMVQSVDGGRDLLIRTAREGPVAVVIAVRDSGLGIAEDDVERIFQAFYTTKTEGMGMGLAIARSIAEVHGGRLTARNNPEGGATFSLALPAADQPR